MSAQQQKKTATGATSAKASVAKGNLSAFDFSDLEGEFEVVNDSKLGKKKIGTAGKAQVIQVNQGARQKENVARAQALAIQSAIATTAQAQYMATVQQVRASAKTVMDAVAQNMASVQAAMANLDTEIQKANAANQARFKALQANILQVNRNLQTVQQNIMLRMREYDAAAAARNDALALRLKGEIDELGRQAGQLVAELKGEIAASAAATNAKIDALGQQLRNLAADQNARMDALAAANAAQLAALQQAVIAAQDAAAEAAARRALGAEQARQAADPDITVYTCSSCGGTVHSSQCSANMGGGTRVVLPFRVKKSQLDRLIAEGRISMDPDPADVSGSSQRIKLQGFIYGEDPVAKMRQILGL